MGTIETSIDFDRDLTIQTVSGEISASDVRNLVELTNSYAARRGGGKTALVFSSASSFGMGRMYDLSKEADGRPVTHASFRDLKAALEWLGAAAGE